MASKSMGFNISGYKGARILVTGGSGFLGRHLVDRLHSLGVREIISIQRGLKPLWEYGGVSNEMCDLSRIDSVEKIRSLGAFDYVFNLAGLSDQRMPHPDPKILWDANVVTLVNLTRALDWGTVKGAVHIGSNAEYGNQNLPLQEIQAPKPTNSYGWSKAAATLYAQMMAKGGYAKWCVVRQFTGYGPGQTFGFIVDLTRALKRSEKFVVSPSYVTRDYIFVDDTIEGLLRLAMTPTAAGEIVNLCLGQEISIGEAAKIVHSIVGTGEIELAEREPRQGDFLRSWGNNDKLAKLTGWRPSVSIAQGLKVTVPAIQ